MTQHLNALRKAVKGILWLRIISYKGTLSTYPRKMSWKEPVGVGYTADSAGHTKIGLYGRLLNKDCWTAGRFLFIANWGFNEDCAVLGAWVSTAVSVAVYVQSSEVL